MIWKYGFPTPNTDHHNPRPQQEVWSVSCFLPSEYIKGHNFQKQSSNKKQ